MNNTKPESDFIIVGAGLTGLAAASSLSRRGNSVTVLESAERPGGRVRTDSVDGFLLDRGFQVFLNSYPEAKAILDFGDLKLHSFFQGSRVWDGRRWSVMADPQTHPAYIFHTLFSSTGTIGDKLRVAKLKYSSQSGDGDGVWESSDSTTLEYLRGYGFSERFIDVFFRPFMGGVFLEPELSVSSRYFRYLYRFFGNGRACLPENGMQAIPDQLVSRIPSGAIICGCRVTALQGNQVHAENGVRFTAQKGIILATPDISRISGLSDEDETTVMDWLSTCTVYFKAPTSQHWKPCLYLNGGPDRLVNSVAVLNKVAPSYSPSGWDLISVALNRIPPGDDITLSGHVKSSLVSMIPEIILKNWELLRVDRLTKALPSIARAIPFKPTGPKLVNAESGTCPVIHAGDGVNTPSIQGALESGRQAAELAAKIGDRLN